MNAYKIFQIKEEYLKDYGYSSITNLIKRSVISQNYDTKYIPEIPKDIYDEVYVYETTLYDTGDNTALDVIYEIFNDFDEMPEDFQGRKMGVGDVVEYPNGKLFYCDIIKWVESKWKDNAE